jgi:hypothetical protein
VRHVATFGGISVLENLLDSMRIGRLSACLLPSQLSRGVKLTLVAPSSRKSKSQDAPILTLKVALVLNYNVITMSRHKAKSVGRPPKFRGLRRAVTVTLPEDTLNRLTSVDADRARAIVKVTDAAMPAGKKPIEVVQVGQGLAIIIVGPSQLLKRIEGLRLIEVAPSRFLLTIPLGTSIDSIEVAVIDAVESATGCGKAERTLLLQLRELIRDLRRRGELSKGEMLFVDTRSMAEETNVSRQTRSYFSSK